MLIIHLLIYSMTTHPGKLTGISLLVISPVVVELNWFPSNVSIAMETSALRELHGEPVYQTHLFWNVSHRHPGDHSCPQLPTSSSVSVAKKNLPLSQSREHKGNLQYLYMALNKHMLIQYA